MDTNLKISLEAVVTFYTTHISSITLIKIQPS